MEKKADGRKGWSIGEICREFGVTARTLRYYEQRGLLSPERRGQKRIYHQRDRQRLQIILRGKMAGFTLAEIGEMLDTLRLREGRAADLRMALHKLRGRLEALHARRREIEAAIHDLQATISLVEGMLRERLKR